MSNQNIKKRQILSHQLLPGMAFDFAGAFWGIKDLSYDDHDHIVLELGDPNGFIGDEIKVSIPRNIGIEIVTEHAGRHYNRPHQDVFSPIQEPLAQWEKDLLTGMTEEERLAAQKAEQKRIAASDEALAALRRKLLGEPEPTVPFIDDAELNTTDQNPGKHLCYDDWSGRYFYGSADFLESTMHKLNAIIADDGDACLNDYYDLLGLSPLPMGTDFGWSEPVRMIFGSMLTQKGEPCVTTAFRNEPKPDLGHSR